MVHRLLFVFRYPFLISVHPDNDKRTGLSEDRRRNLGVSFEDLAVIGLGAEAAYQETLGSLLSPFNYIERVQNMRHPPLHTILQGFEGVIRPGEMLRKFIQLLSFLFMSSIGN
jgi:hypothetical protein